MQVLLLGQPQFREKIGTTDLAQLRQRIIASYHLGPITTEETREYVRHRLTQAGWKGDPEMAEDVYPAVYQATGGVPRLINVLFSRVLMYCFLEQLHRIDGAVVEEVAEDMHSEFEGWHQPRAAS